MGPPSKDSSQAGHPGGGQPWMVRSPWKRFVTFLKSSLIHKILAQVSAACETVCVCLCLSVCVFLCLCLCVYSMCVGLHDVIQVNFEVFS